MHTIAQFNEMHENVLIRCLRTLIGDMKICEINISLFKMKSNQQIFNHKRSS